MESKTPLLIGILLVGLVLVGIGIYFLIPSGDLASKVPGTETSSKRDPASPPKFVKQYADGLGWTKNPPSDLPCADLPTPRAVVKVSSDEKEVTMVVPANLDRGVPSRDEQGKEFILRQGEQFEVTVTGKIKFSKDHPCVGPSGMDGWYDSHVDSPFFENVGGLEFVVGELTSDWSNRFLPGANKQFAAPKNGIVVARIIEQASGYGDDNSGAFTVTVRKQ